MYNRFVKEKTLFKYNVVVTGPSPILSEVVVITVVGNIKNCQNGKWMRLHFTKMSSISASCFRLCFVFMEGDFIVFC